ncbi:MAG TPA: DNA polymerase III subunit gamma/tau, partial [Gammaproteobacteria bacterium]
MSYQVLARKWRPRRFAELVGQEHVVRALVNALEQQRLHHAYLFTGTRGVGKTTVARILAKALNCESGVTAEPCGECGNCREIDAGRFMDLIEVDAASRTGVDDTRDLLDNVQFTPARGRYKVYLIDEVHMFSKSSFNALLKTLEEPPPHVKFLLATTDPQKLPVTVLSRCLQFNLKRLPPEVIGGQLRHILDAEQVPYQPPALERLARAADGSMRDGLSLLDQAIAFGNGRVDDDEVRTLLGDVGADQAGPLLEALADGDAGRLLGIVATLAEQTPDFARLLDELLRLLHRVAVTQVQADADGPELPDHATVVDLAGRLPPEDVQLYYQIALLGRRDLALAPDPRRGCEMTLLRMHAFRPDDAAAGGTAAPPAGGRQRPAPARPAAP